MIITCVHISAPGMGSLLRVFFGKEVGKRKWCETFAGPLVRRLSRAGVLRFIFSKEMLIFLCFCRAFFVLVCVFFVVLFRRSRAQKKSKKKTQFIPQKNEKHNSHHKKSTKKHNSYHKKNTKKNTIHTTKKQKTQFIPQKKTQFIPQKKKHTIHTTKKSTKKNTNHTTKKKHKKTQFIPQKKNKKKRHFPFFFCFSFCFFFGVFFCFFLRFFCFWKVAAFKAFSISQPGPAPAPPSASQPARPLVPHRSPAPRLSPQALPRVSPAAPAFICTVRTHSIVLLSALRWATS